MQPTWMPHEKHGRPGQQTGRNQRRSSAALNSASGLGHGRTPDRSPEVLPRAAEPDAQWIGLRWPLQSRKSGPLMPELGLVSRATPVHTAKRNCTRDGGGPFEFGNQVSISNHRKLLSSKRRW